MKIWFIRHNNESLGPYSIEELKTLSVTKEDYVWKEGLVDWMQAKDLAELNDLFSSKTPPPFTQQASYPNNGSTYEYAPSSATEKAGFKLGKFLGWTGVLAIVITIAAVIYNKTQDAPLYLAPYSTTEKTPEQLRAELVQQEKQNPSQYLKDETKMRTNLIGQKVIEGTVTNSASVATFKDLVLQVDFLSKTDAVISTQKFTIYEVVGPQQSVKFKFKTYAPSETKGFAASIVNATATN